MNEYARARAADASSAAPAKIRRAEPGQGAAVRRDSTIAPTVPSAVRSGAASVCFNPYASRTRAAMRSATSCAAGDAGATPTTPEPVSGPPSAPRRSMAPARSAKSRMVVA